MHSGGMFIRKGKGGRILLLGGESPGIKGRIALARRPCADCVCTTAEHLTNPDTLPRQTSYEGMYSAYDDTNFFRDPTDTRRIYVHEWDFDFYDTDSYVKETELVDLGSTGSMRMYSYGAAGIYSTPATSIWAKTGPAGQFLPRCAFLRRQFKVINFYKRFWEYPVDQFEFTMPLVQPHIVSNDCKTVWANFRDTAATDPYLMEPITIEVKLHGGDIPYGWAHWGVFFGANSITPTGTRTWDIRTLPIGTPYKEALKSLKINGIECVQPQWRKEYQWQGGPPYYEVPAGTICPGKLFAPYLAWNTTFLDVSYGFATISMECQGDYDPNIYIHKKASGVIAMIPADGDLDYLVPIIDEAENDYIEP